MKAEEFLDLPKLEVGDEVKTDKFRNTKAEIKIIRFESE